MELGLEVVITVSHQKRSKIHLQPSQISKFSGEETPGPPLPLRALGVPLKPPLQMSSYGPAARYNVVGLSFSLTIIVTQSTVL